MVIEQTLSIGVAIVLLALYAGNLLFTLVTHRDVFAPQEDAAGEAEDEAQWNVRFALGVLVAATVAAAGCAELVSGTLTASVESIGLPLAFLGVVPLALIGTSADLFAAVGFARQNRMSLVFRRCSTCSRSGRRSSSPKRSPPTARRAGLKG